MANFGNIGGFGGTQLQGIGTNNTTIPQRCIYTPVTAQDAQMYPDDAAQYEQEQIQYNMISSQDAAEGKKVPTFDQVQLSDEARAAQQCEPADSSHGSSSSKKTEGSTSETAPTSQPPAKHSEPAHHSS